MPIYSTLKTIEEVMTDKNIIRWKVLSESEDMLHQSEPPESVSARDSFNTLQKFLNELSGNSWVLVYLYDRKYKSNGGGALSQWVYKHYFHLQGNTQQQNNSGINGAGNGMNGDVMALMQQVEALKYQMKEEAKQREIDMLKAEIKNLQANNRGGYFERVAESIGKSWAQEYLKAEGYNIDDAGNVAKSVGAGVNEKPAGTKTEGTETKANAGTSSEAVKEKARKGAAAITRVMKVAGDTDSVIEGLNDMADLAEKNPMKLIEILQQVKQANT